MRQAVNDVQGNNLYLFLVSCESHKYALWGKQRVFFFVILKQIVHMPPTVL
jgi:hypothetical protein